MLSVNDLRSGDIIVSRKSNEESFFQTLFNSACASVGRRRYGDSGWYLESNHVRGFFYSTPFGEPYIFHWTHPKSTAEPLEDWMLDPSYAVIVRPRFVIPPDIDLWLDACFDIGKRYNYGLLLDIFLGIPIELFGLGLDNEVCSTGIASWVRVPSETGVMQRRFIPADFLNLESWFEFVTPVNTTEVLELKTEPRGLE